MVRVVVVSDTHTRHERLAIPDGDLLIHCGDLTNRGSAPELAKVNDWFGRLPHAHKVAICGNMDQRMESVATLEVKRRFLSNATYLEDELLEVLGLRLYGSPFTPKFCGAFQLRGDAEAEEKWAQVPKDLDVLVTHGPPRGEETPLSVTRRSISTPAGLLDNVGSGVHAGCPALLRRVREVRPRFHFFGHIHEEGGRQVTEEGTTFANAAQQVMVFDIDPRAGARAQEEGDGARPPKRPLQSERDEEEEEEAA